MCEVVPSGFVKRLTVVVIYSPTDVSSANFQDIYQRKPMVSEQILRTMS